MCIRDRPKNSVLIFIDMQLAIDDPGWGTRNNPDAEKWCTQLLARWRETGAPVVHVKHNSTESTSFFRPDLPTNAFKPELTPRDGETIIEKTVNSAFVDPALSNYLDGNGHRSLLIAGVITNNSLEASVRHAGNLGYDVWLAKDGCFTFGRDDLNGVHRSAQEIHDISLMNLHEEYCTVTSARAILSAGD